MSRRLSIACVALAALAARRAVARRRRHRARAGRRESRGFDGARALAEAGRIVGLGPRDANTPGAANAARYLLARLKAQGVTNAVIDEFGDYCPAGDCVFRNVIGRIPGQGPGLVIVASHYDTKSGIEGFEGANDSASSSAVLLELAGVLARGPSLRPEVRLVFFDGEECMVGYGPRDGFHGSRHLADQMIVRNEIRDIEAFILLDMIGDRDLTVTFPRNTTPWLVSMFFTAAAEEGVRSKFSLTGMDIGDDHDLLFRLGVPAVDVIDFSTAARVACTTTGIRRRTRWTSPRPKPADHRRVTLRVLNRLSAIFPRQCPRAHQVRASRASSAPHSTSVLRRFADREAAAGHVDSADEVDGDGDGEDGQQPAEHERGAVLQARRQQGDGAISSITASRRQMFTRP